MRERERGGRGRQATDKSFNSEQLQVVMLTVGATIIKFKFQLSHLVGEAYRFSIKKLYN